MKRTKNNKDPRSHLTECCQMRAVITIDKRGQMILPKKLRDEIGIKAGDQLAVLSLGLKNSYSLILTKVNDVSNMVMVKIINGLDEAKMNKKKVKSSV